MNALQPSEQRRLEGSLIHQRRIRKMDQQAVEHMLRLAPRREGLDSLGDARIVHAAADIARYHVSHLVACVRRFRGEAGKDITGEVVGKDRFDTGTCSHESARYE